jgi:hypothetical protein
MLRLLITITFRDLSVVIRFAVSREDFAVKILPYSKRVGEWYVAYELKLIDYDLKPLRKVLNWVHDDEKLLQHYVQL